MLNENLGGVLHKEVDPGGFSRIRRPSAPRHEQIEEVSFWFCAVACLLLIGIQAAISFSLYAGHRLGDYGSLYASASLANAHANPYSDNELVNHLRRINRHGPDTPLQGSSVIAVNLNPPVLLYPFRLLSHLDPESSFATWTVISLGLFVASIFIVVRMYPAHELKIRVLWILALGGAWYTFQLGQIYTILLLATTMAWWSLHKKKWLAAGIAIGLVCAIKPNFLIWPGLLIVGKSKRIGFTAMATTTLLSAIPLVLQGPVIYRQWIAACRGYNGYELPGNASLLAMFSRAGIPNLGLAVTVLMLLGVTVWIFATKLEPLHISEMGILASLIAGPISWVGYTIVLIPMLYGKSMDTLTRIGWVVLCIPLWVPMLTAGTSRIAYILFWAPSFYGLVLIALSAKRSGACKEQHGEDGQNSRVTRAAYYE